MENEIRTTWPHWANFLNLFIFPFNVLLYSSLSQPACHHLVCLYLHSDKCCYIYNFQKVSANRVTDKNYPVRGFILESISIHKQYYYELSFSSYEIQNNPINKRHFFNIPGIFFSIYFTVEAKWYRGRRSVEIIVQCFGVKCAAKDPNKL